MGIFDKEEEGPTMERVAVDKEEWDEMREERQRLAEKVEKLEGGPIEYVVDEPWVKVEYEKPIVKSFQRHEGKAVFATEDGNYEVVNLVWDDMDIKSDSVQLTKYNRINQHDSLKGPVVARLDKDKLLSLHTVSTEEVALEDSRTEKESLPKEDLEDLRNFHPDAEIVKRWDKEVRRSPAEEIDPIVVDSTVAEADEDSQD